MVRNRGENFGARPIKNVGYYNGPWRRDPTEPTYMGLTAFQFDVADLGLLASTVLAVWLFVFNGTTTARDYLGLEAPAPPPISQQPAPAAPAEQPASAIEQPPAAAAPPAAPTVNDFLTSSALALNDVQSFRGRFQMTMSMNGEAVNSGGDMVFQAPDKMYMTMNVGGQTFEMLALLPRMYIRIPHQGWYVLDGRAMGFNPQVLEGYLNNRGIFDFEAEARMLGGIVQLPNEEIEGVAYLHYQGTFDFQTVLSALPPHLIDPSVAPLDTVTTVTGPVQVDLLLDQTTHLPRRHTVTMDLNANGVPMSMDMRMAVIEYNGSVTIPEAPEDARPFDELASANPAPQID